MTPGGTPGIDCPGSLSMRSARGVPGGKHAPASAPGPLIPGGAPGRLAGATARPGSGDGRRLSDEPSIDEPAPSRSQQVGPHASIRCRCHVRVRLFTDERDREGNPRRASTGRVDVPDQRRASALTGAAELETAEEAADFQSLRPRLFGIAYRMLGRVADAEDVVQDVWVRWHGADRARVRDRVAFLVTITTRVALNVAGSARARREIPVDRWLPERVPTCHDPTLVAERSADLENAVQLLLERLSPIERAVFVLREAFEYPFRDIADALEISASNARQLGRRARVHLTEQRHQRARPAEADQLFTAFLDAARAGDVAGLQHMLVNDVVSHSDRQVRTSHPPFVAAGCGAACGRRAAAVRLPATQVS